MYYSKKNFFLLIFALFLLFPTGKVSADACAAPNSCETPQGGDCPGGRLVTSGSCADGKLCCAPSATSTTTATTATTTTTSTPSTITFNNPLSFGTVEGVLGSLLGTLRAIIVTLALVFIVIGAVMYILSAGNDGMMKTAKNAITASMIGLALGIAAPSFLKQIGDILGWSDTTTAAAKSLTEIALNTLNFLLSVVGVLGIIMLVVGGLTYITAAGNEGRSETGKKIVTYAIIGIAIALASLILVTQIAKLFA